MTHSSRLYSKSCVSAMPGRNDPVAEATRGIEIVYYLMLPDGNIKIGTTARALHRMGEHRRRLGAEDVLALEFGGRDLERQRHGEFAAERIGTTEHFTPSADLLAHIERLRLAMGLTG